jgi:UDP-N-acetylmuramoyl-tripeptide--D-alanyl-D-alanine ligase
MIELSLSEIASAVDGQLFGGGSTLVTGSVETDSRLVSAGSLFFAKPGEFDDGHNFVGSARESGAAAAVVERKLELDIPQIVVADSVAALGALASYVLSRIRAESDIKVIGITGSNGKTTTKNMLREILSTAGSTIAPIESYNNEVGAPISILKADFETKFLVVEMGAGGPGSINYLAQIANPDIGVILKVGLAHVGEFGGIESTAQIKGELARALSEENLLILNADDSFVREMAEHTTAKITWFGTALDSAYRADSQSLSIQGTGFVGHWPDGQSRKIKLQILGEHHIMNALAALAVADALGIDREVAISALEQMPLAERWRMQLMHRADGLTVINDAYNASPDSTKAALQTLAQLGKAGRRTIAVLGEMAELGHASREQHDATGRIVVRLNIDQLVVVGEGAKLIHMGATQEGSWDGESKYFDEIETALTYLRGMLEPDDIVLVKSSKSANLRHLGDALVEVGQ